MGRHEYRLSHGGQMLRVPISGTLQCNEAAVVMQAVIAGAGIAMLPTYLVSGLLIGGELVQVLPQY